MAIIARIQGEGKRGDDHIEIHINGEPQEIAALVLGIQERRDQDIQIDGHSFLDAIDRAQKRVQILSKTKPNAPMMQCSFSKIGDLMDLVVTPNREIAKRYIEKGYMLLTVPQMFGSEDGAIVLALPAQNQTASLMSEADADRVLTDYEIASREQYSS